MNRYEIKNYKSFRGMEDDGFEGKLYRDGNCLVAHLWYEGTGGPVDIDYVDDKEKSIICDYIKNVNNIVENDMETLLDKAETFILQMVDDYEAKKEKDKLIKQMKKKTFFKLHGEDDTLRWVCSPYDEGVKGYLTTKYGSKLKEILNESYL